MSDKICMCAYKYKEGKVSLSDKWIVQPKFDGMRMLMFIKNGKILSLLSRGNKEMKYWHGVFDDHIKPISKVAAKFGVKHFVLDGEVLDSSNDFQGTMRKKAKKADKDSLVYHVFDLLSIDEWEDHKTKISQLARIDRIDKLIPREGNIRQVIGEPAWSEKDVHDYYEKQLKLGYEGIILKKPEGRYEWKRSKSWIKLKPINDYSGRVIAIHPGKGKFRKTAGSVSVEGIIDDHLVVMEKYGVPKPIPFITNVNLSTDKIRKYFWTNCEALLKKKAIVDIQAQEPSFKIKRGEVAKLRFSKFIRLRGYKEVE